MKIVKNAAPRDYMAEAKKIFDYVKRNVKFVRDIRGMETVQTPAVTLFKLKAGDCDDFTTLIGTLLTSIGHRIRIKVVSTVRPRRRSGKPPFTHVYLQDYINGKWVPLDASDRNFSFGFEVPEPTRAGLMEV